jgi:hypothetical protein
MARRDFISAEIDEIVRATRKATGLRSIVDLEVGKPAARIGKTLEFRAALGCSIDITPPPAPKPTWDT